MTQAEAVLAALEKLASRVTTEDEAELVSIESTGTTIAGPGHIWVCAACGKTSQTKYGFDGQNGNVASPGWDESCMLNSVLCHEDSLERTPGGRVTKGKAVDATPEPCAAKEEP